MRPVLALVFPETHALPDTMTSPLSSACPETCAESTTLTLSVSLAFVMPRPMSHYGAKGLKASAPKRFTKKPDADNLAKAVLDALTQLGMWKDDSQICKLFVWKDYSGTTLGGCQIDIKEVVE